MLVAGVAAGLVAWAGSASAGPAVIAGSRVEAYSAPSREASVVTELGQGAPVCVLDQSNYSGVLLHRVGWLAIRLPGGVGYVPIETVDLAAPAPEVTDCGGSSAAPGAQPPAPELRPGGPPIAAFPRQPAALPGGPAAPTSEPAAVGDRPALLPGGFLPLRPARFLLSFGSGEQWLDKQWAAANQIGDSGLTLNGTLGLTLYDIVMISAAFAVAFPSDNGMFSEEVVPVMGGGGPQSLDSSLKLGSYSIAVGLRTPFWALGAVEHGWAAGALFAQIGTAGVSGTRTISDCTDCREDNLVIPGGTFWRVGLDLFLPGRKPTAGYGLTVAYDQYMAGAGLSNELHIGLSFWL